MLKAHHTYIGHSPGLMMCSPLCRHAFGRDNPDIVKDNVRNLLDVIKTCAHIH